ncbi:hypothetical protein FQN55_001282 [Onygenales sp. PD_40]|nr:hypothetical protein FQN55_001282 [Onygenales sp. PD_40]KAK2780707.1 hypothetical protein FQN53_001035 [Emmonsiellopsis sp. PD_33]KAK2784131.1 hypothetical protein FQN52_009296 [Onygenales sp. PD_12]KAK2801915.1 hypothetical protein FQN51_005064 [Onygenales sp. PD_10]
MVQDRLAATTSVTLDLDKERNEYNYHWSLTPEFVLLAFNERLACAVLATAIPKLKAKAQAIEQESNRKIIKILHDVLLLDRCAETYRWRIGGWLRASIIQGYISCVQLLLDSGADPNYGYVSSESQITLVAIPPLQTAWRKRRMEIAELLIRRGANCFLNPATFDFDLTLGRAFLRYAVGKNLVRFAEFLIERGVVLTDQMEDMALKVARKEGNDEMVELLMRAGRCGRTELTSSTTDVPG